MPPLRIVSGQLGLESPFPLAQLGLVSLDRHGPGLGDDLALGLEPIDDSGDQSIVSQVGKFGREVSARDRREPRPGRV